MATYGTCGQITIEGGGSFNTRFISGWQTVASGVTGDLITLTPPTGQKVKLVSLIPATMVTAQSGISISVNGVDVITTKILGSNATVVNSFVIGFSDADGTAPGRHPHVIGDIDEEIKVVKNAGTTSSLLQYAYEFGE